MVETHQIQSEAELAAVHASAEGLVFNRWGKRLHRAGCEHVASMSLGQPKWFFASFADAAAELNGRYGDGWSSCPVCDPAPRRVDERNARWIRRVWAGLRERRGQRKGGRR